MKLTITIGIAGYNAERNITPMLNALVIQEQQGFVIENIIVYSDASRDNTVVYAQEVKDRRIQIIEGKNRLGFAGVVKRFTRNNTSNILILLNDDIKIIDKTFIKKLIQLFRVDSMIGLISGNPQPIPSSNFLENAVTSGFRIYENIRYEMNGGNNILTCDGKVLAISKEFIQSLSFPKNLAHVGNVDSFLYAMCLKKGYKYRHATKAIVYFKCPSTVKDYLTWMTRNNADYIILKKTFGSMIEKEFHIPFSLKFIYSLKELTKNPLGVLFLSISNIYIRLHAKDIAKNFNTRWDLISTSKNL